MDKCSFWGFPLHNAKRLRLLWGVSDLLSIFGSFCLNLCLWLLVITIATLAVSTSTMRARLVAIAVSGAFVALPAIAVLLSLATLVGAVV